MLSDDFAGGLLAEEFVQCRNAVLLGGAGNVRGGFDAEAGNIVRNEISQEIAIVAGDFDNKFF